MVIKVWIISLYGNEIMIGPVSHVTTILWTRASVVIAVVGY